MLILPAVRALQAAGASITWLIEAASRRLVDHIDDIQWHTVSGGLNGGRRLQSVIPGGSRVCLMESPTVEAGIAICRHPVEDCSLPGPEHIHALHHFWEHLHGVPPGPADRAYWRLTDAVPGPSNTALLTLCSSSEVKDWTADGWAHVIRTLQELERLVLVVHGGSVRERQMLAKVRQLIHVADVVCDLSELTDLLASACCLVSVDTGPLHMAGAVGTPVVGIYGYTSPRQWGPYWSQRWTAYEKGPTTKLSADIVVARLRALAAAGYPRAGGEGAPLDRTSRLLGALTESRIGVK